ncbi:MAG: AarF/ABC1/UbiB kinase family protein [Kofleriaceae bacterium]|nr:AarF/ABC1/UbiB kinase family protein [Kofleriaceae bacterium]
MIWIALLLVVLASVIAWTAWSRHRTNAAGIVTSGNARTSVIFGFLSRGLLRHLWLRLRMVFVNQQRKKELAAQAHITSAQEAAALMGNMKGLFMKVGQIVSFAHDGLPEQARAQLQGLQRDAPPMAFSLVRGVIEKDLGTDLSTHFRHVDEEPLAAASIGQVHRAKLRDGTDVVIKVQYPGVDAAIEGDLKMLERLGPAAAVVAAQVDFTSLAAELRSRISEELDYRREGYHQELFRQLWDGHPFIKVPRVFAAATSKRVLTSEFVRGFGYYDFVREANAREKLIASAAIADFVWDTMFCHLIYNGDPHPGNYLFHEDGSVTFIDFGCIKRFELTAMRNIKRFFLAILEGDRTTHDTYVGILGLVKPDRAWDRDRMWGFWRYQLEPYFTPNFVFNEAYLARAREMMKRENMKDMNLPPDLLFFTRITFGLNAIAQKLGAAGDFQKSVKRQFYDGDGPSALGLVGVTGIPHRFDILPIAQEPGYFARQIETSGTLPTWDTSATP